MKSILLVDDSASILMSMSSILSMAQYAPVTARTGAEALAVLRAPPRVDLMITDLHMPEMDGIALIREARKLQNYRFSPFLVLTTESEPAMRAEAKAAGATGWLVKPVKAPDFLSVLQKLLGGK